MNEIIKALFIQAGGSVEEENGNLWTYSDDLDPELFAQLVVRECAEQIIAKGTDWVDFAPSQTGVRPEYWDMTQQIKKHFGVEE